MTKLPPPPDQQTKCDAYPFRLWFTNMWAKLSSLFDAGLQIPASSASLGSFTLVAGVATVPTTLITANTVVLLTVLTPLNPDVLTVTRTVATSFTVTSANVADVSVINYLLVEPV